MSVRLLRLDLLAVGLLLALGGTAALAARGADPPPPDPAKHPIVVLEITQGNKPLGTVKIQLDAEKAPVTTKNFVDYVNRRFYDGTVFHRVVPEFVIQGGG